MALYVFYKDSNAVGGRTEFVFHVGSGKLLSQLPLPPRRDAVSYEVQADGDELERIKWQFTNIRMTTNRVVYWKDEDAQFIVDNLKL